jgi:hypothetical protein
MKKLVFTSLLLALFLPGIVSADSKDALSRGGWIEGEGY